MCALVARSSSSSSNKKEFYMEQSTLFEGTLLHFVWGFNEYKTCEIICKACAIINYDTSKMLDTLSRRDFARISKS